MKHTDSTTRAELFKNNTKTASQENEISTMSEITQAAKMRPWLGNGELTRYSPEAGHQADK
jgi:hypothetical protein